MSSQEKTVFLFLFCDVAVEEEVKEILENLGYGYSYFSPVYGSGRTGRKELTPIFPGANVLFFCLLPEKELASTKEKLKKVKESYRLTPAFSLFVAPAERLL